MGPSDPRRLLSAVVAASAVGYASAGALPLLVGALMDGLALDEARAGLLGSIELASMAAASLALTSRVAHVSRGRLAVAGGLVTTAGHGLSALATNYDVLLAMRMLCGVGEGTLLAAATAAAASSTDPDRLFAKVAVIEGLVLGVVLTGLPHAIRSFGYAGAFFGLGILSAGCLPLIRRLPPAPAVDGVGRQRSAPNRGLAAAALGSLLLLSVGEGALWPFTERIGLRVGLSGAQVGATLAVATVTGLSGAAAASWLGTRLGRALPITVGLSCVAVSTGSLGYASEPQSYGLLLLLWSFGFFFSVPYFMGACAALDPNGRWTAAAIGTTSIGVAVGPLAAGVLVARAGYSALGWLVVACAGLAFALVLPVVRRLDTSAL